MQHLGEWTMQNEVQKYDLRTLTVNFLGLAGDAVAKDDICKFQEGRSYILLTSTHLALLLSCLFFSSTIFLSKAFKIHSFLRLSIYRIPSNIVLRGPWESSAHDSRCLSVCHP